MKFFQVLPGLRSYQLQPRARAHCRLDSRTSHQGQFGLSCLLEWTGYLQNYDKLPINGNLLFFKGCSTSAVSGNRCSAQTLHYEEMLGGSDVSECLEAWVKKVLNL